MSILKNTTHLQANDVLKKIQIEYAIVECTRRKTRYDQSINGGKKLKQDEMKMKKRE